GRGYRQQHGAARAFAFGDLDRALDRGLVARHHHLPAAIIVGGLADLALRGFSRNRGDGVEIEAAISAGCAFSVSVSVSAGPSNITAESLAPSAASTSANTSRAGANRSA